MISITTYVMASHSFIKYRTKSSVNTFRLWNKYKNPAGLFILKMNATYEWSLDQFFNSIWIYVMWRNIPKALCAYVHANNNMICMLWNQAQLPQNMYLQHAFTKKKFDLIDLPTVRIGWLRILIPSK